MQYNAVTLVPTGPNVELSWNSWLPCCHGRPEAQMERQRRWQGIRQRREERKEREEVEDVWVRFLSLYVFVGLSDRNLMVPHGTSWYLKTRWWMMMVYDHFPISVFFFFLQGLFWAIPNFHLQTRCRNVHLTLSRLIISRLKAGSLWEAGSNLQRESKR